MKVRMFVNEDEPDEIELDIIELEDFVGFIKKYGIIDAKGEEFEVISARYDSSVKCVEVSCVGEK